ncbi:NUDIX domain-containing protein [Rickettsiales endosymbiont of Stachyamoeba lipophora]|uniref:NUDIX domain-containing protein n=1 Tax=Rickettsiales endosymbiont of Stachyamoeba lipophora TaxID=2486578 RepID=UPI000F64AB65|nr:NUDIX domain-containing protein [Rickettsiales endosymbiont of Stachyamoeba lipophora]AZL16392.1 NUDIX domain-containing protein [Rickettsiales endosymbiont of Stachyamoeba lipophora]
MNNIVVKVRGVIVEENHILLLTPTEKNTNFNTDQFFLPGGHVELGEPAWLALRREIKEELGINTVYEEFLGVLECSWNNKGRLYHEINMVFKIKCDGLSIKHAPQSLEDPVKFIWCPLSELEKYNILPQKFLTILPLWLRKSDQSAYSSQML